jgi:hypothetical protein
MRGPGRFNIDLSLRRTFQIRERSMLEFAANATNLLNHTQFGPTTMARSEAPTRR